MTLLNVNERPTPFADLNEVLSEFLDRAASALGSRFVGAYLVGSFALGDADEQSDVDFLVVTEKPIAADQEAEIRSVHAEFPDRDVVWAQHLEGSYPPHEELRTVRAIGKKWLYVDNGAKQMERSTHCNTALVRWTLRERGIVLAGPQPGTLVDPVSAEDLRAEAVRMAPRYYAWLDEDWNELDNAWTQPYTVVTYCRILGTLATGRVLSKREALRWALENLDEEWRGLIQAAIDDRPDPWGRVHRPARPGTLEPTRRFVEYAMRLAGSDPEASCCSETRPATGASASRRRPTRDRVSARRGREQRIPGPPIVAYDDSWPGEFAYCWELPQPRPVRRNVNDCSTGAHTDSRPWSAAFDGERQFYRQAAVHDARLDSLIMKYSAV